MFTAKVEKILRESERALLVLVEVARPDGEPADESVWLPKSQINVVDDHTVEMPAWLAAAKERDMEFRPLW
ncbi:MAG: hypothetical protein LBC18_16410 [Opitutaceae bacterium]|jgi:hypothetical protein|nr:hypothetical protein [Opitutaceae bacterium]